MYDLNGEFDLKRALKDLDFFGTKYAWIEDKASCASDIWIEYDKRLFKDDSLFEQLINDIQKIELK